jgi:dihydroorotase-like cyclic amidohydrolase
MKKTLALLTILSAASMTGCASTGDMKGSGNTAFDEAAATANEKNAAAMKVGYAWTSTAIKNQYGSDKTEAGKAFKESGKKLSLVDVAVYEGEQALKKGDTDAAMKKVAFANELADAQLAQEEQGKSYQILWK